MTVFSQLRNHAPQLQPDPNALAGSGSARTILREYYLKEGKGEPSFFVSFHGFLLATLHKRKAT